MAVRASFTRFDPYRLTGVRVTDQELGHGSYATVLELEYPTPLQMSRLTQTPAWHQPCLYATRGNGSQSQV